MSVPKPRTHAPHCRYPQRSTSHLLFHAVLEKEGWNGQLTSIDLCVSFALTNKLSGLDIASHLFFSDALCSEQIVVSGLNFLSQFLYSGDHADSRVKVQEMLG